MFSILFLISTMSTALADESFVELPSASSGSRVLSFSTIQFTNAYKLYVRHQFGEFAGKSYFIRAFHTVDECLKFAKPTSSPSGIIHECNPGRVKIRDSFVPAVVAKTCALPALRWLSARLKKKTEETPTKVTFAFTYNDREMPSKAEQRDSVALRDDEKETGTLTVSMFWIAANVCEAHAAGKTFLMSGNAALNSAQVQAEIKKLAAKF